MSISISGVYPEPSSVVAAPVQTPSTPPPAVTPATEIPDEDTVTLSQSARVDQLSVLGASPAQIADNLGISLSTVDIDLGIVAATDTVPVVAAHPTASATAATTATAAPAAPASTTKAAAAAVPAAATTTPATTTPISPSPAVQTASV